MDIVVNHLVVRKQPRASKTSVNKEKRKFNQLMKKIKTLEAERDEKIRELDNNLKFYYETIAPEIAEYFKAEEKYIKAIFTWYKKSNRFSKKMLKVIKEIIMDGIQKIFFNSGRPLSSEINDIFFELNGCTYEEKLAQKRIELVKKRAEALGIDFDPLSVDIQPQAEDDETEREIAFDFFGEEESMQGHGFRKTQKQQEHEEQKELLEKMQTKNFDTVYKQLVKAIHPDLEKDKEQKAIKEDLMKTLTIARTKKDFFALLLIQFQWQSKSTYVSDEETFKIYNELLKNQVKAMKEKNDVLSYDEKYAPIKTMECSMDVLKLSYKDIKKTIASVQKETKQLESLDGINLLERMIQEKKEEAKILFF